MNRVKVNNGWYIFEKDFFDHEERKDLYARMIKSLPWEAGEIKLFGKTYSIPRLQCYFGDENKDYSYSGKQLKRNAWTPELLSIKQRLELVLDVEFNACLANLYRHGLDSNGWHADNEGELGVNPIIASLSFGVTRRFDLRYNETKQTLRFELNSGSLFVMGGEMQRYWKHQVPKQPKITEPRVNMTFRRII